MTETEIFLNKLETKGLKLPELANPGGSYVSVNIRNTIAYIAIQFPILNGAFLFQGRYGENLTLDDGYLAMQLCTLNVLSQIHHKIGFEKVLGLNHMDAYYRAAPDWDEAPKITNGASDLFVEMLQEKGQHSRAIFGVEQLPRHFSVGICCSVTLL